MLFLFPSLERQHLYGKGLQFLQQRIALRLQVNRKSRMNLPQKRSSQYTIEGGQMLNSYIPMLTLHMQLQMNLSAIEQRLQQPNNRPASKTSQAA